MPLFKETELILTNDKRVYHINLKSEDIADDVILVGDPGRVSQISTHFTKIDFKTEHREFVTHTGWYNNKRITVLSTGIGTDNIDIVINELDAAVNINPETREENTAKRKLNLVRLGTSGALQEDIPVNALVVSSHGLGLDGLLNYYKYDDSLFETAISENFMQHCNWEKRLPYPYCVKASEILISKFKEGFFSGITATAPGFYGPQGRQLRVKALYEDLNEKLTSFRFENNRISNFEMETSALYGLGKLLGHECLTICVIIANRVRKEFTKSYQQSVELLINTCLNKLTE